jgi:hypothetical protein
MINAQMINLPAGRQVPNGQWQPKGLPGVTCRFLSRKQDNTPLQCGEDEKKKQMFPRLLLCDLCDLCVE